MRCIPPSLLFLLLGLSTSCIEIGDVYPYHLSGDDDDSAGDDDDSAGDDDDSAGDDDDSVGDDDDATPCDLDWIVDRKATVSLAFEIEPVFALKCDPCHTVQDLGMLRLSPGVSHEELVDVPNLLGWDADMPRVTPGNPQQSYLLHKLVRCDAEDPDWGHFQSTMPPPIGETASMTDEEISLLWSWVVQGAQDN